MVRTVDYIFFIPGSGAQNEEGCSSSTRTHDGFAGITCAAPASPAAATTWNTDLRVCLPHVPSSKAVGLITLSNVL